MIRNWQIAHSAHFDAVLIAGDLGCFPDPSKFDKAMKRWIDRDPEEAGFAKYFTSPAPEVERLFQPELGKFSAIRCPILFVAGNHEDYDYIARVCKQASAPGAPPDTFPVDCYKRVHCMQDGPIVTIPGKHDSQLRIAGIWGIENTRADAPYKISPGAVQRLQARGKQSFDLLLTHDAPAEAYSIGGSTLITQVIRTNCPKIHVFGHVPPVHKQHEFSVAGSPTKSLVFKDVSFGKDGREGLVGSMGVLEWDGPICKIEIVNEDWLKQMRPRNWEQVLAEPIAA
jgi:hypothetical protein